MSLGVLLVPLGVPRLDLFDKCGLRRDTAPQTLTAQMAQFDLCHVEPTAVFGGRMDLSFLRDAFRLRGIKGFIQRCCGMGMQIVHHQTKFFPMGIRLINKCADKVCPLYLCSLLSNFGIPLASEWFKSHKNICGPLSLILSVISQRLPRLSRERSTDFTNELGRHFISTHLGTLRIIRIFINI
jgi:hypothetical protein